MNKTLHVAVDIGYGYVKGIASNGNRVLFPTLIGSGYEQLIDNSAYADDIDKLENIHVEVDGKQYFVGELAKESETPSRIFSQERFKHEYTKTLLNVAIHLLTEGKTSQVNVSTGLPLSFYQAQAKEFKESIIGEQPVIKWRTGSLKGKKLHLNIKDAVVFPQGASAIYTALLNSEGRFMFPELMDEGNLLGLIDIGYRTTDFIVVEMLREGSFKPRLNLTNTLDEGASNLHRAVEQEYKSMTGGADLSEFHRERIIRNGKITYRGKPLDFEEIIEASKQSIANNIADRLNQTWAEDSDLFEAIFLAGGGGALFEHYLQSHYDNRLHLISENQFANVIGYLRHGNSYFRKK